MKKNKKDIEVRIVKAFEIDPNKKYLFIIPKEAYQHPQLGPALINFFKNSEYIAIAVENPDQFKIIELNADSQNQSSKKTK